MVKMKRPRSAASDAASNQPRSPPVRPTSSSSSSSTTRINFGHKESLKSPLFSRFKPTSRSPSPIQAFASPTNENRASPSQEEQLEKSNLHHPHDNHSFKKPSPPPQVSRAKSFVHGLQTFVGGLAMAGTVKNSGHSDGGSSNGGAGAGAGSGSGSGPGGRQISSPTTCQTTDEQCKYRRDGNDNDELRPRPPTPSSSSSSAQQVSDFNLCSSTSTSVSTNSNTSPSRCSPSANPPSTTPSAFTPRRVKLDSIGDDPTVGIDVSPGWHVSIEGGIPSSQPPLKDDDGWSPAQSFPGGRLPPRLAARFSMRRKRGDSGTSTSGSSSGTQKYDGEKEAMKKLHEARLRDQERRNQYDQEMRIGSQKGNETDDNSTSVGEGKQELHGVEFSSPALSSTTSSSNQTASSENTATSLRRTSVIRASTESGESRASEMGIGFHRLGMESKKSSRAATPDLHIQDRASKGEEEKTEGVPPIQQTPSESKEKGTLGSEAEDPVEETAQSIERFDASFSQSDHPSTSPARTSPKGKEGNTSVGIPDSKPIAIKVDTQRSIPAFDARVSSEIQISPKDSSRLDVPIPPCTSKALIPGRRPFYRLSDFEALDTLGTGTFGRVLLVKHKLEDKSSPDAYYAMKILNKAQVVRLKQVEHINNERSILAKGPLPFAVSLYSTFQDSQNCYMLMEYVQGGEIFSHLRKARRFPVDVTRFYISLLVLSISDLHSRDIIYRDLKPENLLLDSNGYLKITDFGFSKFIPNGRTWTLCGTPEYLAPEIIQSKGHGKPVDWWALGVLMYEMLAGYPPFFDDNPFAVYEKILMGKLSFPPHIDAVSRDLIRQLLTPDRTRRLGNLSGGSDDVKNHYWFHGVQWDSLSAGKIKAPIIPRIRSPDDTCNYADYQDADPDSMPGMIGLDTPRTLSEDPYSHLFPDF